MRYVYGYRNTVFNNLRPEGDEVWFPTRAARNIDLQARRTLAVERGLSATAAKAGLVAIRRHVASDTGAAWLRELESGALGPGVAWEG